MREVFTDGVVMDTTASGGASSPAPTSSSRSCARRCPVSSPSTTATRRRSSSRHRRQRRGPGRWRTCSVGPTGGAARLRALPRDLREVRRRLADRHVHADPTPYGPRSWIRVMTIRSLGGRSGSSVCCGYAHAGTLQLEPPYAERMKPSSRFLLAGLAAAATTANAVRPAGRKGTLSMPAFAVGLPSSEFPLHTGLLQLAAGALLARSGGARRVARQARHRRARRVARRTRRGAPDGQSGRRRPRGGDGGRAGRRLPQPCPGTLQPAARSSPDPPAAAASGGAGAQALPVCRDISYGDAGMRNHLDIWKRADLPLDAKAPVLFQVHGGGWTMGKKEGQGEPLMAPPRRAGLGVRHRQLPALATATWPDHIVDVKTGAGVDQGEHRRARRRPRLRRHHRRVGRRPPLLTRRAHLQRRDFQPGFEDADTSVAAAVPFYGVYDFVNRHGTSRAGHGGLRRHAGVRSRSSPTTAPAGSRPPPSATSAPTPRRSSCSTAPTTRSYPSSRPAASSTSCARRHSNRSLYAELPGAQHAFDMLPSGAHPRHRPRRRALPRRDPQRVGRAHARRSRRRAILMAHPVPCVLAGMAGDAQPLCHRNLHRGSLR